MVIDMSILTQNTGFRNKSLTKDEIKYISLNLSANLLGLGNAATPFGIAAMKELNKNMVMSHYDNKDLTGKINLPGKTT